MTAGLIALVYGIVNVQEAGWTSASTIFWGALALVLLAAFVVIEQRQRAPLVRLGIFRVRTLRAANVTMLLVASGLFAMFFFNTLYVQRVLGFSPLQAGLAFLPVTVGIGIGAGLSQPGVKRLGIRTTSIIGMTMRTVGMLLLLTTDANGTYLADVLPGLIPISIGMGLTFVPGDAARDERRSSTRRGPRVGPLQHVAAGRRRARARDPLDARGRPHDHALGGLSGQPTPEQQGEALVTGFHAAFFGGAVFFVAGIVVLITLLKREDDEQVDIDRPMTELGLALARLQRVERDAERDREPAVDRPLGVAGEVEVVGVADSRAPVEVAEVPVAGVEREVEQDRDEVGVGDRSRATRRRKASETERSCRDRELLLVASKMRHVERKRDCVKTFSSTPIFSPSGAVTS